MRFLLLFSFLIVLGACSGTPDAEKPLDLAPIEDAIGLQEEWRTSVAKAGIYVFQPAVVGPAVFAADPDGVVRIEEGKFVWRAEIIGASGGVAADATQVIVGTLKGQVVALSSDVGKPLWRTQLGAEVVAPAAFSDELVIVRSGDNRIHGLDRVTGERRWTYQRSIPALSVRSTATPVVKDEFVFAGFPGGKVLALTLATGVVAWEGTVALPKGATELERIADVVAAPVVGAREICAVAFQGRLVCFDLIKGSLLWARDVSSASGLALDAKAVYVTSDDGLVYAFDRTTGGSLWKQDKLINRGVTAPLPVQGFVVVADSLGGVHFLDANDGAFKARLEPDVGGIVAPLTALDGSVLIQSRRGFLISVRAQ